MRSKGDKDEEALRPHVRRYLLTLFSPLVVQIGAATPLFENSQFFADDGWWKSLTGEEQLRFVLWGWGLWILLVTVVAVVSSFFSRRWQQKVWKPAARKTRSAISWFGWRLVSPADRDQLLARQRQDKIQRAAATGPPKGKRGLIGSMHYGPITTHVNRYDSSLRVEWTNNKQAFGRLVPSIGGTWEIQYGRFEGSVRPQFVLVEALGRAATPEAGVEQLRVRDLKELEAQGAELGLDDRDASQHDDN